MKPAYRAIVAVSALSFMLPACTIDAIMSADGFRSYIGEGGAASRKTTFEVDRNYREIGKTFADRGAACVFVQAGRTGGVPFLPTAPARGLTRHRAKPIRCASIVEPNPQR